MTPRENTCCRFLPRDWYGKNSSTVSVGSRTDDESWFPARVKPWPEADTLKKAIADVVQLQVKMHSELRYAKREVTWSKLGSKDMVMICRLLKDILIPIFSIESLTCITDRIEKRGGWGSLGVPKTEVRLTDSESNLLESMDQGQWNGVLEQLNYRTRRLMQSMVESFDHALYTLELANGPYPQLSLTLKQTARIALLGRRASLNVWRI